MKNAKAMQSKGKISTKKTFSLEGGGGGTVKLAMENGGGEIVRQMKVNH